MSGETKIQEGAQLTEERALKRALELELRSGGAAVYESLEKALAAREARGFILARAEAMRLAEQHARDWAIPVQRLLASLGGMRHVPDGASITASFNILETRDEKQAVKKMLDRAGPEAWKRLPREGDVCIVREVPVRQRDEVRLDPVDLFHLEVCGMARSMARSLSLPFEDVLARAVAFESEVVDAKGGSFRPGSIPRVIHQPLVSKVVLLLPRELGLSPPPADMLVRLCRCLHPEHQGKCGAQIMPPADFLAPRMPKPCPCLGTASSAAKTDSHT